jgi:hypothetical protein
MAINPFFQSNYNGVPEQTLVEDLIIESIKIYGIDCLYVPRDIEGLDTLFTEDKISSFSRTYEIELYVNSVESFGGDRDFLSKFGLEIRDEVTFTIAKKRFGEEVVPNETELTRPREGDLIYFPLDKRTFEITFVEDEAIFYELGKLYTYELRCKVFELGSESFDTGIPDIDVINTYEQNTELSLSGGSGDYIEGETVRAGNASATVVEWDNTTNIITLADVKGDITLTPPLVGDISEASYAFIDLITALSDDPIADNKIIETKSTDIIDFSEDNPFSE